MDRTDNKRRIDRRKFIKDMSLASLGLAVGPSLLNLSARKSSAQGMSKVVIANHPETVNGMKINTEIVQNLVDTGVMQLTGQTTIADAWASILVSPSPDDLVTIKVNCINRSLPTHPEVVNAIIAGLIAAGVKENNIIIWDRTNDELNKCGYKINTSNTGVRCFGTNEKGWGYDNKQVKLANKSVRLSKILTSSDHIINVPVLKDHGAAGVTLSMKNHYGSVDNPASLHRGQCDPYIGELNNIPDIRDNTRLIVLDGLIGIYKGGPGGRPQFVYNSMILSQDPVALDYQGWKILETERQKQDMTLPQPKHIKTAAGLGLGTNNPNNIHVETANALA